MATSGDQVKILGLPGSPKNRVQISLNLKGVPYKLREEDFVQQKGSFWSWMLAIEILAELQNGSFCLPPPLLTQTTSRRGRSNNENGGLNFRCSCSSSSASIQIIDILQNKVLIAAAISGAIGQCSKPFTSRVLYGAPNIDFMNAFRAGGFPSTHSSAAVAAAITLGLERGFSDSIFGLAVVYACLIMYDAQGVRREVGNHAKVINKEVLYISNKLDKDASCSGHKDANCNECFPSRENKEGSLEPSLLQPRSRNVASNSLLVTSLDQASSDAKGARKVVLLKETIGHTEMEVIAGAVLGFFVSLAASEFRLNTINMRLSPPWKSTVLNGRRGGLGLAAIAYVGVDYLRHWSPRWHGRLQPVLWTVFAIAVIVRVPFYKHWSAELRSALPFVFSLMFMLSALLFEAISVRFVTVVLGEDWHNAAQPLPDTGQWLLLAWNEKLPEVVVSLLRARIIGLHHYLMLFVMLAFSVLFNSVEAPGLGLGARYMFTMGVGRILRALGFVSTILPSPRPWCASVRFHPPAHPHHWAQKYYTPYATDSYAIRQVIYYDMAYADPGQYGVEYRPDWGPMSFLIDFLRPTPPDGGSPWYHLLKKAGGGCNDLIYSGHMLVSVLTAMAWTEAYGGVSSILIWLLVLHSAQREIRERNHYTVDCLFAIYMGFFLWKMIGLFWPRKDTSRRRRLDKLDKVQGKLMQAAKDSDMDRVKEILNEVEVSSQVRDSLKNRAMWVFSGVTIFCTITMVLLAFTLTSDG
ncbi:OLC1v1017686C1 [Oldenlandia corymbosa var. corymbosa]|uniref:OLC1v1017686C1 n=1 Tax=Oldenlandia corymbosa var. corymbosa TaxID=529605 RepID=A0AAV1EA24_OLDCO|nr:OLC1v1017686C1 [Oldenlandia corymbosa var. corymbosa]